MSETIRITITKDSERGLWRIEVIAGDDCVMSRVAHSKEEYNHLFSMALDLKESIELIRDKPDASNSN